MRKRSDSKSTILVEERFNSWPFKSLTGTQIAVDIGDLPFSKYTAIIRFKRLRNLDHLRRPHPPLQHRVVGSDDLNPGPLRGPGLSD